MTRNRRKIISVGMLALAFAFLVLAPLGFKPYGIFILSMWAVMTIAAIGLPAGRWRSPRERGEARRAVAGCSPCA